MKPPRIYVDTSVIGGCLDAEFAEHSNRLFDLARSGKCLFLVSDIVIRELEKAPAPVLTVLKSLNAECIERVDLNPDAVDLRNAYLAAHILIPIWIDDLTHVALATVVRADAIVSWNFKHIVRLDKMKAYNSVNLANGYGILTIISPMEVMINEED